MTFAEKIQFIKLLALIILPAMFLGGVGVIVKEWFDNRKLK